MNRAEREELERARQAGIRWYNEAQAEQARYELSRVPCGAGCDPCYAPDCQHSKRVNVIEMPE